MKIDKITFKNNQVWITIYSENGIDYLGTWHSTNLEFVEAIRKLMPSKLEFKYE
jgi:hypothetical protein